LKAGCPLPESVVAGRAPKPHLELFCRAMVGGGHRNTLPMSADAAQTWPWQALSLSTGALRSLSSDGELVLFEDPELPRQSV